MFLGRTFRLTRFKPKVLFIVKLADYFSFPLERAKNLGSTQKNNRYVVDGTPKSSPYDVSACPLGPPCQA